MKSFLREFGVAAREAPRMYFAPLVGAFNAVKAEVQRSPSNETPGPSSGAAHRGAPKDSPPAPTRAPR